MAQHDVIELKSFFRRERKITRETILSKLNGKKKDIRLLPIESDMKGDTVRIRLIKWSI